MMILCGRCNKYQTSNLFGSDKSRKTGKSIYCRGCRAKLAREARAAKPHVGRNHSRYSRYGITKEVYDYMSHSQNDRCAICLTDTPGGGCKYLFIDHDHSNGNIRGLLCRDCNLMLGHAKDNINSLVAAIAYLQKYGSTKG